MLRVTSATYNIHRTIGAVTEETEKYNEQMMVAFNKWYKGKGRGQWHKGNNKGRDKGGKKGDSYYNYK
eukprot:1584050-Amphidinium_carterae.1